MVRAGLQRRSRWILALMAIVLAGLAVWQAVYWTRAFALDNLRERSAGILRLTVDNLGVDLARFIFLPRVLSTNPALLSAVDTRADGAALSRADRTLEQIEGVTGAADIFLYDVGGTVIAGRSASGGPSVIGENLSGAPFFMAAIEGRLGRFFTVDAETRVPIYAYSHAVRSKGVVRGVVVVVIDLGRAQDKFKLLSAEHEIIVSDREQVIFLSSNPDWRLQSLQPLTAADRKAIELDRRYAGVPVARSSIGIQSLEGDLLTLSGGHADNRPGLAGPEFLRLERPLTKAEWTVAILVDTSLVRQQATLAGFAALIAVISLLLLVTAVYQRRRRIHERLAFQTDANIRLEERVHERTAELTETNRQLHASVLERQKAEDNLRLAQEELIQSSKLAALGQMSAGLSHELNQPLAAIRSYADNARAYLDRGQTDRILNNLSGIGELTERMAKIIRNLRTYARNEKTPVRPVLLSDALDQAASLLETPLRDAGAVLQIENPDRTIWVMGGDVRLQQVFINLISNAIDAVTGQVQRDILIAVTCEPEVIICTIRDSGTGIGPDDLGRVFDPFFSTKEVGMGTGLGLSITYGIVQLFGGQITAANHPDGGALFTLRLRRAAAAHNTAEVMT